MFVGHAFSTGGNTVQRPLDGPRSWLREVSGHVSNCNTAGCNNN